MLAQIVYVCICVNFFVLGMNESSNKLGNILKKQTEPFKKIKTFIFIRQIHKGSH